MSRLQIVAESNGGLVTKEVAREIGVSAQRLNDLVRRGALARIARGVYKPPHGSAEPADPRVATVAYNVVVSYESAAAWCGADLPVAPGWLHVTAPRNRGRRRHEIRGLRLHRASLSRADVMTVRGVRVTTPLRTALDVSRHASLEDAVAIVDSLMRARLLSIDEFAAMASKAQGPGRRRLQVVALLVDPKSASILESRCRVLLWRHDLRPTRSQYPFRMPTGAVAYIDFAWPELRVVLECDGYEYHSNRAAFEKDRRRWSAINRAGWTLAVVTWFDVTNDPAYVVALVKDLLANAS